MQKFRDITNVRIAVLKTSEDRNARGAGSSICYAGTDTVFLPRIEAAEDIEI